MPRLTWRLVLLDGPARLVELWFRAYHALLTGMTIVTVTLVVVTLVLAAFGVRWGW